jgi:very-short-patch-repair endonuclease
MHKSVGFLCQQCGVAVPRRPNPKAKAHFCSRQCANLARRKSAYCKDCGATVQRIPHQMPPRFCGECRKERLASNARRTGHANRKPAISITCRSCGAVFDVAPSLANRQFCGLSCYRAHQRTISGSDHWNWKVGKITRLCEVCETPFEVFPYRAATARVCSGSCRGALAQMANRRTSSIEWLVADELDRRRLLYDQFRRIGNFFPDFIVGDTVVEVDGDYWHTLPAVQAKDQRKNSFYVQHGFAVVHIWEHEVNAGDFSKLDALASI